MHRIEREAEETLTKASALIVGSGAERPAALESAAPPARGGTVGQHMNNPGAEVWGVGKSKL